MDIITMWDATNVVTELGWAEPILNTDDWSSVSVFCPWVVIQGFAGRGRKLELVDLRIAFPINHKSSGWLFWFMIKMQMLFTIDPLNFKIEKVFGKGNYNSRQKFNPPMEFDKWVTHPNINPLICYQLCSKSAKHGELGKPKPLRINYLCSHATISRLLYLHTSQGWVSDPTWPTYRMKVRSQHDMWT